MLLNPSVQMSFSLTNITVYKASYIDETKRHLNTRIKEYLGEDKKSHISHSINDTKSFQNFNFYNMANVTHHLKAYLM